MKKKHFYVLIFAFLFSGMFVFLTPHTSALASETRKETTKKEISKKESFSSFSSFSNKFLSTIYDFIFRGSPIAQKQSSKVNNTSSAKSSLKSSNNPDPVKSTEPKIEAVRSVAGVTIDAESLAELEKRVGTIENLVEQLNAATSQQSPNALTIIDTASGENLIRNSSFENGGEGSLPSQWKAQLDSTSENTRLSKEGIHSGSYGLKFAGGGTGNFGISQPDTKTIPQRTYNLSLYIKVINAPSVTFRLGFWDEKNNKEGPFKNFSFSGTQEWKRISTSVTTPGIITDTSNYFPMIQVQGVTSGNVYIDDVQLTEGAVLATYNTAQAKTGGGVMLGDGSILTSISGDIYPAQSGKGRLGTTDNRWDELYLSKATIDKDGTLTLENDATVKDALTVNGNVTLGDATTDTISATGRFNSNLIPSSTRERDLGSSSLEWNSIFGRTLTISGDTTYAGDLAVNGGDLTTTATTFNLINGNATTVNFAGAATSLTVGATTGTTTIRNATTSITGNLGIGTSTPGSALQVNGAGVIGFGGAPFTAPSQGLVVSGNTGIGISSPTNKLSVLGTADIFGGNLGIGTSSPGARLAVAGGTILGYAGTQSLSSGTDLGVSGNVGIGTTSPSSQLHVIGAGLFQTNLTVGGNTAVSETLANSGFSVNGDDLFVSGTVGVEGSIYTDTSLIVGASTTYGNGSITQTSGETFTIGTTNADLTLQTTTAGDIVFSPSGGNVGIGTAAPTTLFAVAGAAAIGSGYAPGSPTAPSNGLIVQGNVGIGTSTPNVALQLVGATALGWAGAPVITAPTNGLAVSGNVGIGTTVAGASLQINGNAVIGYSSASTAGPTNGLAVLGNVGIGTTSPAYALQVVGTANITGASTFGGALQLADGTNAAPSLTFSADTNTGLYRIDSDRMSLVTGGASALTINSSGNVGIGTTGPTEGLHVIGNIRMDVPDDGNGVGLLIDNSGGVVVGGAIRIRTSANVNRFGIGLNPSSGASTDDLQFVSFDGSGWVNRLTIQSVNGNVGIGTISPTSLLSVAGTAAIGSGYAAGSPTAPSNGLIVQGNVGIGTSTPGAALQIAGAGIIGFGLAPSVTVPANGLAVGGNVGIGVSNPIAKLHVEGQCVAVGTRIRRRRKGRNGKWIEEDVPVEDIEPGDEVLSLNEKTEKFEWHRVAENLDMGIQQVFHLITKSGKHIKTTANHPYLVADAYGKQVKHQSKVLGAGWVKVSDLEVGDEIAVVASDAAVANSSLAGLGGNLAESNKHEENNNEQQSSGNLPLGNDLIKIHNVSPSSSDLTASFQNTITKRTSLVNTKKSELANIATNQTTTRLEQTAENTRNWALEKVSDNSINSQSSINQQAFQWDTVVAIEYVGEEQVYDLSIEGTHNFVAGHYINRKTEKALTQEQEEAYVAYLNHQKTASTADLVDLTSKLDGWTDTLKQNLPQNNDFVNGQKGMDSPRVEPGRLGVSIQPSEPAEPMPQSLSQILGEDVNEDDIVYGGIVAHNTYISGNLGVGTSSPGAKLSVAGGGLIGYSGTQAAPSNGLAVLGNVGIGTTSPSSELHVVGAGLFQTNLTVGGNTAVSETLANSGFSVNGDDLFVSGTVGVEGSIYTDTSLIVGASTTYGNGSITQSSGETFTIGVTSADLTLQTTTAGDIVFSPSGGNVGIGTASPTSLFAVAGAAAIGSGYAGGASTTPSNGLIVQGNVGIGTSTPGAALQVAGAGIIGFGLAPSVTVPANGLAVGGNVGIGVSNPIAKLHVEGQCVAVGTRIRRRRKGRNGKWIEEDVPVEDIQPADEVLSLNEKTGEFEWHTVEKTMDMGIQEVFAITTSSTKRILTTANHPYFVIDKPKITYETFEVDQSIRVENVSKPTFIGIASITSNKKLTAKISQHTKKQILKTYQKQNKPNLFGPDIFAYAVAETLFSQHVLPDRLIIDTEYTGYNIAITRIIKMFLPETEIIFKQIGKHSVAHKVGYEAFIGRKATDLVLEAASQAKEKGSGHKALRVLSPRSDYRRFNHPQSQILLVSYYTSRDLSRAKWKKVSAIIKGQYIATADGWEKITGIEKIKSLQTYDLQIANTHNFVGNGIVAHNTYISGNLGIGTSSPGAKLSVAGAGLFGYSGTQAAPSNGLAVLGNVGIGTTSPSSELQVIGAGLFQTNLTVGGNTAVSETLANSGFSVNGDDLFVAGSAGIEGNVYTDGSFIAGASTTYGNGSITQSSGETFTIGTTNADLTLQTTTAGDIVFSPSGGNVGIGTASPTSLFAVAGTAAIGSGYAPGSPTAPSNGLIVQGNVGIGTSTPNVALQLVGATALGWAGAPVITAPTNGLAVSGNVGIGTTVAGASLQVNGNAVIGYSSASTAGPVNGLAVLGNVGIGTTSPAYALQVVGTTNITGASTFGGALQLADGTNAAPSLTFLNDTNTGLYRIDSDRMSLVTGALSRMTIDSAGNVGIGTTGPGALLDVRGSAVFNEDGADADFRIEGVSTPNMFVIDAGATGGSVASINSAVNAGTLLTVGSAATFISGATARGLFVNQEIRATGGTGVSAGIDININHVFTTGTTGDAYGLRAQNSFGSNNLGTINNTFGIRVLSASPGGTGPGTNQYGIYIDDQSNATNNYGLIVAGADNVGIGTAAPTSLLGVAGTVAIGAGYAPGSPTAPSNGLIVQGNVGIGTSTPGAALQVAGAGIIGFGLAPSVTVPANGLAVGGNVGIGVSNPGGKLIVMGGNVGIGTASPTNVLDVNGAVAIGSYAGGSPTAPSNGLIVQGNVGIGTSTPGAALQVAGAGIIGFGLAPSVTVPANGLAVGGNVGIGVTNPVAKLHVEGQCVTGDTRLRRKRRRRRSDGTWEEYFEDVAIKNIKPGDEILTMDESTGQLVVSKVKALMDMGKKGIYKLTTASGKTIRTTGNHPYFVKTSKETKPKVGIFIDDSNIFFAAKKLGWKIDVNRLVTLLKQDFSVEFANYYVAIPDSKDKAYAGTINYLTKLSKDITIVRKPLKYIIDEQTNKPAKKGNVDIEIAIGVARKIDDVDLAIIVSGDSDFVELARFAEEKGKQISFIGYKHNMAWELRLMQHLFLEKIENEVKLGVKKNPAESGATKLGYLYQNIASLSSGGKWTKVTQIKKGDQLAVTGRFGKAVWEKVVKIEKLPAEQVYDIEVQDTHNFVGNGIVAHNTYISGNLGVGTSSPGAKLSVAGAGLIGYSGTQAAPSNGLAVLGNVGIGTTSPSSQLHVIGAGLFQTNLTVGGNTAVSETLANSGFSVNGDDLFVSGTVGVEGSIYTDASLIVGASTTYGNGSITQSSGEALTIGVTSADLTLQTTTAGDIVFSPSGGNVGIGTAAPTSLLGVAGTAAIGSGYAVGSPTTPSNGLIVQGNVGIGTSTPGAALQVAGAGIIGFGLAPSVTVPANGLAVGGNVGIGTSNPGALLDVRGAAIFNEDGADADFKIEGDTDANLFFVDASTDRVGIGTNVPGVNSATKVEIRTVSAGARTTALVMQNDSGTINTAVSLDFTPNTNIPLARINALRTDTGGAGTTDFIFSNYRGSTATLTDTVVIKGDSGNVGIGTSTPGSALQIVGAGVIGFGGAPFTAPSQGLVVSGNVGIGISSPTNKLSVLGTADIFGGNLGIGTSSPGARLAVAGGGLFGYSGTQSLSSGTDLAVFGNVGIGLTNPTAKLQIDTASASTIGQIIRSTDNSATQNLLEFRNASNTVVGGFALTSTSGAGQLKIGDTATITKTPGNAIFISSMSTPGIAFRATDGGADYALFDNTSGVQTGTGLGFGWFGIGNTIRYNSTTGNMLLRGLGGTNNIAQFEGNVGIGTTAAGASLQINGNQTIGYGTAAVAGPTNGLAVFGNVGIGTTSPGYNLQVVGTTNITGASTFGGALQLADGTSAAPSLTFTNDTNSGLYRIDSDRISLVTGGLASQSLTLNSSGNVGIGTTNPSASLQINSGQVFLPDGIASAPSLSFTSNGADGIYRSASNTISISGGGGEIARFAAAVWTSTNDSSTLRFGGSGVSILAYDSNLTSAAFQMGVDAASPVAQTFKAHDGSGTDIAGANLRLAGGSGTGTGAGGELIFSTAASGSSGSSLNALSERMRITSGGNVGIGYAQTNLGGALVVNGNVGIGTSTPGAALQVAGAGIIGFGLAPSVTVPANGLAVGGNVGIGVSNPGGKLIVTGGNVGIGTNAPGSLLEVSGGTLTVASVDNIAGTSIALFRRNDATNAVVINNSGTAPFGGTQVLDVGSVSGISAIFRGNVGIGSTSPGSLLAVQGGATIGSPYMTAAAPSNGLAVFGNVGIGTTSPGYALQVVGTTNITGASTFGGALQLADGSQTAPSLTFTNDTDTGIYRNGANQLTLVTGGSYTNSLTLNSSGNVGIGTTGPQAVLDVRGGDIYFPRNQAVRAYDSSTGLSRNILQWLNTSDELVIWNGNTTSILFGSSTSPYFKMTVAANDSRLEIANSTTSKTWYLVNEGTGGAYTPNSFIIRNDTDAINALTILNDGNVGIGGAPTAAKLYVNGNVGIGTSTPGSALQIVGAGVIGFGGAPFTAPSQGLVVSGNVGVGISSPTNKLSVLGTADIFGGNLGIGTSSPGARLAVAGGTLLGYTGTQAAPTNGLAVFGNVGIGTTSPAYALQVVGTANITGASTFGGALQLADGTSAAPSLTFTNDTNSGLYRIDSDRISLVTGGLASQSLTLNSSGNVGIGTTGPVQRLQIEGDINLNGNLRFASTIVITDLGRASGLVGATITENAGGNTSLTVISAASATAPTVIFREGSSQTGDILQWQNSASTVLGVINSAGNVGIGTAAPTSLLGVAGAAAIGSGYAVGSPTTPSNGLIVQGNVGIGTSTPGAALQVAGAGIIGFGLAPSVTVPANGLAVGGNVGIGVSNPGGKLIVTGGNVGIGTNGPGAPLQVMGGNILLENSFALLNQSSANTGLMVDNGALALRSSGTNMLYINQNVGVAIGGAGDTTADAELEVVYSTTGGSEPPFMVSSSASGDGDWMIITNTGNVGIGTTGPGNLLHLSSGANVTGLRLERTGGATGTWDIRTQNITGTDADLNITDIANGRVVISFTKAAGNVGIGTATPYAKLQLVGTGTGTGVNFLTNSSAGAFGLAVLDNGNVGIGTTGPTSLLGVAGAAAIGSGYAVGSPTTPSNGLIVQGNVGIGTSVPGQLLDVVTAVDGGVAIRARSTSSPSRTIDLIPDGDGGDDGAQLIRAGAGQLIFQVVNTQQAFRFRQSSSGELMRIDGGGNVGIGSSNPTARLQLVGNATIGYGEGTAGPSNGLAVYGNVGIGTTSPNYKVEVIGSLNVTGDVFKNGTAYTNPDYAFEHWATGNIVKFANNAGAATYTGILSLEDTEAFVKQNFQLPRVASASGIFERGDILLEKVEEAYIHLFDLNRKIASNSAQLSALSNALTTQTINLGLFSIASSSAGLTVSSGGQNLLSLDALGNMKLAGTITSEAGAFDIAEEYPVSDESIEAGDVVVLDSESPTAQLVKSSQPYDNSIIGIISTKPGLSLSGDGSGKPVALTGRVPVKVTTENGAISVGDSLTSSSIPGLAMKATRAGVVIGKALESFSCASHLPGEVAPAAHLEGEIVCQGKIMVFVNVGWYDPSIYFTANGNLTTAPPVILSTANDITEIASDSATASSSATLNSQLSPPAGGLNLNEDPLFKDLLSKVDSISTRLDVLQGIVVGTESAELIPASSSAELLAQIKDVPLFTAETATISGTLTVAGRTTLSDVGITGSLNAGLLTIEGMDATINTLAGDLKLQNLALGGIDILAGKIKIDTKGNIVSEGTITAKEITAEKVTAQKLVISELIATQSATLTASASAVLSASASAQLTNTSIGSGNIPALATKVTINTSAARKSAKIFITPTSATDKPLAVVNIQDGKGFDVVIPTPTPGDITFNWWLVETK